MPCSGTSRQNGIALSIALGQLGKLFGFPIDAGGIIPRLLEFIGKLGLTHGPTLAVGLASFAVLLVAPRVVPRVPAVVTMIDVSGLYMARDFIDILSARGVTFGMAGRQTEWSQWNERHKLEKFKDVRSFPTVGAAIKAYGEETGIIAETAEDE
jgi:hypothetical protein